MASAPSPSGLSGPPGLAPLGLEHEREYVRGFPVHVAIELALDRPHAELALPNLDVLASNGLLGLGLRSTHDGAVVVDHRPHNVIDVEHGMALFTLRSAAPRRVLVDLAEVLPPSVAPGTYTATVGYLVGRHAAWSPAFALVLRAPTPDEQALLDLLAGQRAPRASWGDWTLDAPPAGFAWPSPPRPDDPLRFNRALRDVLYGPADLARLDRAVLDPLGGVYAAERAAIWAEALHARGDGAGFAQQAAVIAQHWPGLAGWMAQTSAGQGPVGALREALHATLSATP